MVFVFFFLLDERIWNFYISSFCFWIIREYKLHLPMFGDVKSSVLTSSRIHKFQQTRQLEHSIFIDIWSNSRLHYSVESTRKTYSSLSYLLLQTGFSISDIQYSSAESDQSYLAYPQDRICLFQMMDSRSISKYLRSNLIDSYRSLIFAYQRFSSKEIKISILLSIIHSII